MSIFNKTAQASQLKAVRKVLNLTQTQIASILGIEQGYYSELERGIKQLSFNMIENIANCFKKDTGKFLNLNWLLLGVGEMYLVSSEEQKIITGDGNNINIGQGNTIAIADYDKAMREKEKEIARLQGQVELLKEWLAKK
jgi:transcriptional regulator with XRE-family HTH domain